MTREQLEKILKKHPMLTKEGISKAAGKSRKALVNSLPRSGEISPKVLSWVLPQLEKYNVV